MESQIKKLNVGNIQQLKKKMYLAGKKISSFRFSHYATYLNKHSVLLKYWDFENNWGDQVNPYLVEKLTGRKVISSNTIFNFTHKTEILGIGSIISGDLSNYAIWGSGIISEKTSITKPPKEVLAIRGKNTQKKIREVGADCSIMGDPVLLFPEIFPGSAIQKKYKYGIIPHFKNKQAPAVQQIIALNNPEIKIIDIQSASIEGFVEDILSCEHILSSSLHGLIVAEAYGIPTLHVVFSEKLLGGDFKFYDYYSGVGIDSLDTVFLHDDITDLNNILRKCSLKDLNFNGKALKQSLVDYLNQHEHK